MLHYVQDVAIYLTNKQVPYLHYKQGWCCINGSNVTSTMFILLKKQALY